MSPARRSFNLAPTPATDRAEDWRSSAACTTVDPNLFDPALYDMRHGGKEQAVAEALAVCASCPVRQQCLEALFDDKWLILGGTTPEERARLRRKPRRPSTRGAKPAMNCVNGHDTSEPGSRLPNRDCRQCARDRSVRQRAKQKEAQAS